MVWSYIDIGNYYTCHQRWKAAFDANIFLNVSYE